jgi:hypothetical protein
MKSRYMLPIVTRLSICLTLAGVVRAVIIALTVPLSFTFHSNFSSSALFHSTINSYEQKARDLPSLTAQSLLHIFSQQLSGLAGISLRRNGYRHMDVYVHLLEPISKVGDKYVLLKDGTITVADFYTTQAQNNLPELILEQPLLTTGTLQHDMVTFIENCALDFFSTYIITWINKTNILLQHKSYPYFRVVAHAHSNLQKDLLSKLEHILDLIRKRPIKKRIWQADVRFKEFIVLSHLRGDHEKITQ